MKRALLLVMLGYALQAHAAAPAKTRIQDTLYKADATVNSGYITVKWNAFVSAEGKPIPAGNITSTVTAGVVDIYLVPNASAAPAGTSYSVTYVVQGPATNETWVVPSSVGSLTIAQVKVATAPVSPYWASPATDSTGVQAVVSNGSRVLGWANFSGIGGCTNQFVRTLNNNAVPTCATVGQADVSNGYVDQSSAQASIGGAKTFTGPMTLGGTGSALTFPVGVAANRYLLTSQNADATKGPWTIVVDSNPFLGTNDEGFCIGYNCAVGGGNVLPTEPSLRWKIEQDYNVAGNHLMEMYWEYRSADGLATLRPLFLQYNKTTNQPTVWTILKPQFIDTDQSVIADISAGGITIAKGNNDATLAWGNTSQTVAHTLYFYNAKTGSFPGAVFANNHWALGTNAEDGSGMFLQAPSLSISGVSRFTGAVGVGVAPTLGSIQVLSTNLMGAVRNSGINVLIADNSTFDAYGIVGTSTLNNAGARTIGYGVYGGASHEGAGSTHYLLAVNGNAFVRNGTGYIAAGLSGTVFASGGHFTYAHAVDSGGVQVFAGATIDTARSMYVSSNLNSGGVLTNNIGLEIGDQTAGTNNLSLLTHLGLVQFGDKVCVGCAGAALGNLHVQHLSTDVGFVVGQTTNYGVSIWGAGSSGYGGAVLFSASRTSAAYTARDSAAAVIDEYVGDLRFFTDTGLTAGNTYAPTLRMTLYRSGGLHVGPGAGDPGLSNMTVDGNVLLSNLLVDPHQHNATDTTQNVLVIPTNSQADDVLTSGVKIQRSVSSYTTNTWLNTASGVTNLIAQAGAAYGYIRFMQYNGTTTRTIMSISQLGGVAIGSTIAAALDAPANSLKVEGDVIVPAVKSLSGTRFVCADTDGKLVSSTTACSGT